MAAIGGINCDYVRGVPQASKLRVETWVVKGISGTGVQLLGDGDGPWKVGVEKFWTTNALADAWLLSMQGLQGAVVTIVTDWGVIWGNRLVTEVGEPIKEPRIKSGVHGVRASITLSGVPK